VAPKYFDACLLLCVLLCFVIMVQILGFAVGSNTLLDRDLDIFPLNQVQRTRPEKEQAVIGLQQWIKRRKEDILSNFIPSSASRATPSTTTTTALTNIPKGFHKPTRHMLPEHMLRCNPKDPIVFKISSASEYYKTFFEIARDKQEVEWWTEKRRGDSLLCIVGNVQANPLIGKVVEDNFRSMYFSGQGNGLILNFADASVAVSFRGLFGATKCTFELWDWNIREDPPVNFQSALQARGALSNSIEDQLCMAALHYLRSHFEEATEIYKKLLIENKDYHAINIYVALCYYKMDYYDVSLEILAVYLGLYPDSIVGMNLKSCNHF
jgi:hypothetical protein